MFTHIPMPEIRRPFVEQLPTEKGHYYKTESGMVYPSITTVQHSFPNPGIEAWKAREPNWEKISKSSMDVGTAMHEIAEDYLNNRPSKIYYIDEFEKSPVELFETALKPHLDKHVNNIRATETKLYSDELRLAGTVDCVAEYDGIVSIIDFKNSRKPKTPSNLKQSGYYEQTAAYKKMWQFCTNMDVKQAVVLVVSWDNKCRPFIINPDDYLSSLWDTLIKYETLK